MKRTYVAILLLAAFTLCACSTPPAPSSASTAATPAATVSAATTAELEKTVIDHEKKMWELAKGKQVQEYRNALAPGYRGVGVDGIKDADKDAQNLPTYDIKEYALSDFNTTFPNQDTAVITYMGTMTATTKGVTSSGKLYASSVWAKQNGDWKCVLYSATKAEPQSKK